METKATSSPGTPDSTTAAPSSQTFAGNSNDLIALIALTTTGVSILSCITGGYGIYCLPFVSIALGVAALGSSKRSMDPARSRKWGWISVGGGSAALVLALVVIGACILMYIAFIGMAFLSTPRR
jgi:hypothetical protein